ncbi:hypothetical protein ACQP2T_52240 [Nonomuraea sp. CA-143628]|uniref:hypothetical protein n=1 Tax=Nonomuraea sp. CA-143628 TaxID=3239997 RepID=UPI003D94D25A
MFADGAERRTGSDTAATGTATLTKDGRELAKAELSTCDVFDPGRCELRAALPAGTGAYTLTASLRRSSSALSTAAESVWTFRSGTTAKEQALPLMAVRFRPEGLDDANRAAAGSVTRLPLWIERDPGSEQAAIRSLRLEMSADDGAHWRAVPVARTGSGWTAAVPNSSTTGFVSLRAVATDMLGQRGDPDHHPRVRRALTCLRPGDGETRRQASARSRIRQFGSFSSGRGGRVRCGW